MSVGIESDSKRPDPLATQAALAEAKRKRARNWAWMAFAALMGVSRLAFYFADTDKLLKPVISVKSGDHPRDLFEVGNRQMDSGDYPVAISTFSTVIRNEPGNAMAYADRAMAHYWNEDYRQAKEDADKAESLDKANAVVPRVRGMLSMRERHYDEALAGFTRSLQLEPKRAFTYYQRALAYEADKQPGPARADAEAAIRLQPDLADAYNLLARLARSQGDMAGAGAQADALLKVAKYPRDYVAAARIRSMLGQSELALAALERGIAAAPDVNLYTYRARLLRRSDLAGRQAAIQAALALDPEANEALLLRGELESDSGNDTAAVATYSAALADVTAAARNLPALLAGRGIAYSKLGRLADAERDFDAAQASSGSPMKLNNLCWNLATHNVALPTALEYCEKALSRNPRNATILDSKGFVLLRLGRNGEAVAAYDAALAQLADVPASLYGRGIARQRQGDQRGGGADIRAALALDANIANRFADYGVKS